MSRSGRLLTSARTARLPAPSVSLVACSVLSFKPQMATRAPSRSNSCAAARPIPLLPPVIRIFFSASLPIVVTPFVRGGIAHALLSPHDGGSAYEAGKMRVREMGPLGQAATEGNVLARGLVECDHEIIWRDSGRRNHAVVQGLQQAQSRPLGPAGDERDLQQD